MHYPGNPALAAEIQQRILRTFLQTLELAAKGSRQEAILGCDFILRMDPAFEAGRLLMNRLAAAGEGPVEVSDLERLLTEPAPKAAEPDLDFDPFDLEGELPSLPSLEPEGPRLSALAAGLKDLLAAGELKRLIQVAEQNRQEVAADPEARKLVEQAYQRLEAAPYVASFLEKAEAALAGGNPVEAGKLLAKARSLDAEHPGLTALAARLNAPPTRPPASDSLGELASQSFSAAALGQAAPEAGWSPLPGAGDGGFENDGEARIRSLLAEGHQAFERGDSQSAIDAWSRIFLINIDHQEAAQLIERARRQKAENERKVEELYHDAVAAFDRGDRDRARQGFERILQIQPGYYAARDYLEQLESGSAGPGLRPVEGSAYVGGTELREEDDFLKEQIYDEGEPLSEEILQPPPPPSRGPATGQGTARATASIVTPPPPSAAPARPRPKRGRFLVIASGVLVLLLGSGYLVWQKWNVLFPNTGSTDEILERARTQREKGKLGSAIALLRGLPKDYIGYEDAQQLADEWEQELKSKKSGGAALPSASDPALAAFELPTLPTAEAPPTDPSVLARWEVELVKARDAFSERENLLAFNHFQRAAAIAPLAGEGATLAQDVRSNLEVLKPQLAQFYQKQWDRLVPELETLLAADATNKDLIRLLADTRYDLGVRELREGRPATAATHFDEAVKLLPTSASLRRHRAFAQSYQDRPVDLLYQIYVKYLPFR